VNSLPFEEMWEDDRYWSQLALEGKRFEGWFYYSGDFEKLVDCKIVTGSGSRSLTFPARPRKIPLPIALS